MPYFLLFFSVLIDTIKNIYYNNFGKTNLSNPTDAVLFNFISCIGSALFFLIIGTTFKISTYSFFLSILFAIVTAAAQFLSLLAMSLGPMSFSVLFTYLSMIIPTLFGVIIYSQPVTFLQIVGLALMILTFILSLELRGVDRVSLKWVAVALGSFIAWGLVGILQQIHQNSIYKHELDGFLLYTFLASTVVFCLLLLLSSKRERSNSFNKYVEIACSRTSVITIFIGIIIGLINKINLYLSGVIASVIFFPIINGGVIILSSLAAVTIFKERLSKKQLAGLITGILSTCLLGL